MSGDPFAPPSLTDYIRKQWGTQIAKLVVEQIELVVIVMLLATVVGVGLGLLIWRRAGVAEAVIAVAAALLTVPSLALLTLMIPVFGLGWTPAVIALIVYAQLPIIRNTVVGLRGVDASVLEAARAMGMGRRRVLWRIQFPLALPVIIAGLRVSSMLIFGISAIAAYVAGPGLGDLLFSGLDHLGSFNAMNMALTGAFGITLLALLFDAALLLLIRATTSRGAAHA
ncbi:MAG: ABC transporter permease [Actinomycetes bacterium]